MKKLLLLIILVAIGAFLWWTVSPLFINTEVQDDLDADIMALIAAQDETAVAPESTEDTTPPSTSADTEEPLAAVSPLFPIEDTRGHPATGNVRTIETPDETIVRFEDYNGTNGPDLFVYLAKDLDATEFVNLGRAKGNMGNINYTVPEDVDLSEYQYVMTWCRAFGVLFDYAEIN